MKPRCLIYCERSSSL